MSKETIISSLELRKVRVLSCHIDARELSDKEKNLAFELQAGYSTKSWKDKKYWYARLKLKMNWNASIQGDTEEHDSALRLKYVSTCELRREKDDRGQERFMKDALPVGLTALLSSARAHSQAAVALLDIPISLDTPLIDIGRFIETSKIDDKK